MHSLEGKRIILGVGGSISAYKACAILRTLRKLGAEVKVAPTKGALAFVSPLTFEALSAQPILGDSLEVSAGRIPHVDEAYDAQLALIAPASADLMAKMAQGIADEGLLATLLSFRGPLLIAPAMETRMWDHPATQANVALLERRGAYFIGPDAGPLASGREGKGRLAPEEGIVEAVLAALAPKDLAGIPIAITAGPTVEDVDPVRYLTNRSSGKMGVALARAAAHRGAFVHLVHGPLKDAPPELPNLNAIAVRSAHEMHREMVRLVKEERAVSAAILAAAVADYRPTEVATEKLKKTASPLESIPLTRTPDIFATLGALDERPFLVGFAAETESVVENARAKLERKGGDLICANDVSGSDTGFGADQNAVTLVYKDGRSEELPRASKDAIADSILDALLAHMRNAEDAAGNLG